MTRKLTRPPIAGNNLKTHFIVTKILHSSFKKEGESSIWSVENYSVAYFVMWFKIVTY